MVVEPVGVNGGNSDEVPGALVPKDKGAKGLALGLRAEFLVSKWDLFLLYLLLVLRVLDPEGLKSSSLESKRVDFFLLWCLEDDLEPFLP